MSTRHLVVLLALVAPLTLAACGGPADARSPEQAAEAVASAAPVAAQPTGTIIEVKMITDDKGNYFEPSTIEARPGDVIRLVLVSGVHNFSMPADRNSAGLTLPPPTDLLQQRNGWTGWSGPRPQEIAVGNELRTHIHAAVAGRFALHLRGPAPDADEMDG